MTERVLYERMRAEGLTTHEAAQYAALIVERAAQIVFHIEAERGLAALPTTEAKV